MAEKLNKYPSADKRFMLGVHVDRQIRMNGRAGRQAGRQTDRQTGRQPDRQPGSQTGRQAGRHTDPCSQTDIVI